MSISPAQLKEARRLLGWTLSVVGGKSDLSTSTISFFETGRRRPSALGVSKIRKAFEDAGVEFMRGGEPLARLAAFTVSTAVRDDVEGVELIRGPIGKREWMTHEAAQQQAERMRRAGDPTLWRALTMTSGAPLAGSLSENSGGAAVTSRKRK
jgi:transcriptional regulator with XRE-family HTH domain